jgi:hypothetical protein
VNERITVRELLETVTRQADKIAELQKDISFLQSCVNSGEYAEVKDRPSNKSISGAE